MNHEVSPNGTLLSPQRRSSSRGSHVKEPASSVAAELPCAEEQAHTQDLEIYKKFFTVSSDMICVVGLDGRFQRVNPAFEQVTGYTEEEIKQKNFLNLVHPDDVERVLQATSSLKSQGLLPSFTNRYQCKDGSYRWLTWHSHLLEGTNLAYASARDVTDRVVAEEELSRSEEKFRLLAENMADVVILHQIDATIDYVSPSVKRILGYSPSELIGMNPYEGLIHPEDAKVIRNGIHQEILITQGRLRTVECRVCQKDGTYVWFESTFKAVRDQQQQVVAIVTSSRDISDRKREEERSREFEQRLLVSNEELENFAYVASHDLQEPLRVISSFLQVLQRRYQDQLDERAGQFIDYAVDGANRMKKLITDLLAYSRVNSLFQERQSVDLNIVLGQIEEDLQLLITKTKTTLHYEPLPTVYANESLMYRVFLNLISNGIKFRSEHPPRIDIVAEQQEGAWQFEVSDNGIGIEAEYSEAVFDIFTRLNGHKYEGTGMGLSIVKKVIENYQGTVRLDSRVGEGTTFCFTLPQPAR